MKPATTPSTVYLSKIRRRIAMKSLISIILLATITFLTGCEVSGPSAKVEPPKVKVDAVQIEGSNGSGDFCAPGQAKKGNC